jgi:hypothetical protein
MAGTKDESPRLSSELLACRGAKAPASREDLLVYRAAVDAVSFIAGSCTFVHKGADTPSGLDRELATLCELLDVDIEAPLRVQDESNRRRRRGGGGWCIEMDLPAATASGSVCIAIQCSEQSEDVTFSLVPAVSEVGPTTVAQCLNRGCLDDGSKSLQVWTSLLRLSTFVDGAAVRTTPPPSRLPPKPQWSPMRSWRIVCVTCDV